MVKLFSQVIACIDRSLNQFYMKPPVENTSEDEVWSEAKSLKLLSEDSKLERFLRYGEEIPNGKILDSNETFHLSDFIACNILCFYRITLYVSFSEFFMQCLQKILH